MYSEKTAQEAADKILARLVAQTSVDATSSGSMAKTLSELIGQELGSAYSFMSSNLQQVFVSTAGGDALDRLASIFGISRKVVAPIVNAQSGALFFYLTKKDVDVLPGVATDVATTNVTIPAGTVIGCDSLRLGSDDPDLFRTTEDLIITAGSYMAYVSAEPFNSVKQSVGVGKALYHNFTPTEDPVNASNEALQVNVYNRGELSVTSSIESDTNLRYRIVNALSGNAGATALALRMSALNVEGVRDCKVIPLAYGIGTVKVIVVLEQPVSSGAGTIFLNANNAIRDKAAVGDVVTVARPLESSVDMTLKVSFKNGSSDPVIVARVEAAAKAYIDSLTVGDTLSISRLYGILTSISPIITNVAIVDESFEVDDRVVSVSDYVCDSNQQLFAADVLAV